MNGGRTVGGVISGVLLLIFTQAIVRTFGLEGGAPSAIPVILRAVQVLNAVLLLATLIAVAVVIYAGITMVVFVGNEEKFGAAKSLIIRVLIGIAVILVSLVLINFVIAVMAG